MLFLTEKKTWMCSCIGLYQPQLQATGKITEMMWRFLPTHVLPARFYLAENHAALLASAPHNPPPQSRAIPGQCNLGTQLQKYGQRNMSLTCLLAPR